MEIVIASIFEALLFEPEKETYAIRIFGGQHRDLASYRLKESPLFVHVAEYVFDDLESGSPMAPHYVWPTSGIADRIVAYFQAHGLESEVLLAHCLFGRNRAPAVAIALNDTFGLGQDSAALKRRYPHMNTLVYALMLEAGKRISLCDGHA